MYVSLPLLPAPLLLRNSAPPRTLQEGHAPGPTVPERGSGRGSGSPARPRGTPAAAPPSPSAQGTTQWTTKVSLYPNSGNNLTKFGLKVDSARQIGF